MNDPSSLTRMRAFLDAAATLLDRAIDEMSVPDNSPPTIVLSTVPSNFDAPGPLTLIAGVSDNRGYISRVELRQGGVLIDTKSAAPFEWRFDIGPGDSTRTYEVKAFDGAGNAGEDQKTVTVDIPAPAPTVGVSSISGASVTLALDNIQPDDQLDWGDGAVVVAATSLTRTYSASGTRTVRVLREGVTVASVVVTVQVAPPPTASALTRNYQPNPDLSAFAQAIHINDTWVEARPQFIQPDGVTVILRGYRWKANGLALGNNGTLNAVHISTTKYVIEFRVCSFAGYGTGGTANGIIGGNNAQRVRLYESVIYGLEADQRGYFRGRALQFDGPAEIVMQNCDLYNTCGVAINGWSGAGRNLPNTVNIRYNRVFELDGRIRDPDQPALYPGGPSGYFIGNTWGGDSAEASGLWGSGTTGTVTVAQSRAVTSIQVWGTHNGGQIQVEALVRGAVVGALIYAAGEGDKTLTLATPVWLGDGEKITLRIGQTESGATLTNTSVRLRGLPAVGIGAVGAVGDQGTGRVKLNHELLANGGSMATQTGILAEAHTGGAITFDIIDRDTVLNTQRTIGTATLPAGSLTGTVNVNFPEILRTGHQLILQATGVPSGASCTNVRVAFYSRVQHSFVIANLVQMNNVQGIDRCAIGDNLVVNTPGRNRSEDTESLYRCSGTPSSPIIVENSLKLGGSEPYDPWFDPANPAHTTYGDNMPQDWPERYDYRGYASSGGLGLLGDGNGDTDLTDPAYAIMRGMTVIAPCNYGIGIAGGHDLTLEDSDIYRSGYAYGLERDVVLAWGHVGVQVQDYNTGSDNGNSVDASAGVGRSVSLGRTNAQGQTTGPRWYSNRVRNMRGGYMIRNRDGTPKTQRSLVLRNSPLAEDSNHTEVQGVTRAMENARIQAHLDRWTAVGVTVGRA